MPYSTLGAKGFSLYLHIPYCLTKCPYCDFNSYATARSELGGKESRYCQALAAELAAHASDQKWAERPIVSIFFGGGTPSLLSAKSVETLFSSIRSHFRVSETAEITLEANPGTLQDEISLERLQAYRAAGVNRISMGAQSFFDAKLKSLGRLHSALETRAAFAAVREAGFSNVNLDLIYGLAGESSDEWSRDLGHAIALGPEHISAYTLTLEPGTDFFRRAKRNETLTVSADEQADLYELTQELLAAASFEQYEISNFAQADRVCRHNLSYWDRSDYLGVGAGAHSFHAASGGFGFGQRWSNIPGPEQYIERAGSRGTAIQNQEDLTADQAKLEYFQLGLRTYLGIAPNEYESMFAEPFPQSALGKLRQFAEQGLVKERDSSFTLSKKGFLFADGIAEAVSAL